MKKPISVILTLALLAGLMLTACAAAPVEVEAVDGSRLSLSLNDVPAGRLVAAAYDPEGGRMAALASSCVWIGTTQATLDFRQLLTGRFTYKAFLLDIGNSRPLLDAIPLILPEPEPEGGKVLVACFSATNNTKGVAEKIAAHLDADLYQITPEVPYTSADLNYNTDCRANREQNDPAARPAISGDVANWNSYDVVFLGYPIWWGVPPKIMHTFVEGHDWTGKTVIPFCTSGSSPYNDAAIRALAAGANWITGRRFPGGASASEVQSWVDGLNLPNKEENTVNKLNVTFNDHSYTATLADNPGAAAFLELLKQGPVTIHTHDYGGWEKVGDLGTSLGTANDEQTRADIGDFVLYSGDQIVLFYGSNSWSYTRLGKLDGDLSNLRSHLGSGNVDITYALAN